MTLDDVTPLARLTGEYEVIAVTGRLADQDRMADLVAKLKADPGSVSWGGGSAGGTDQILVGLIAKAVGVDPAKVNYIAHSGGGEAMSSILGGHVTAGVNGVAELMPQIAAGKLRPLGDLVGERVAGIDVPTLKEQGIDVALTNWRGVMAPAADQGQRQEGAVGDGRSHGEEPGLEGHARKAAAGSTSTSRPTSSPRS